MIKYINKYSLMFTEECALSMGKSCVMYVKKLNLFNVSVSSLDIILD